MANNRMYLRCKGCGAEIMLGKVLGGNWYFTIPNEAKGAQLQEFINKHGDCCKGLEEDTCGGVNPFDDFNFEPFELTYENRDDYGHQKTLQDLDKELHPDDYVGVT